MELTNIRSIAPPVSAPRVSSSTDTLRRPGNQLNYVKANQKWWVGVRFNSDADVMVFEKSIQGSSIRLVEFEGEFYIADPSIPDTGSMEEPFRYAKEDLPRLNAAVKLVCPRYVPAQFRCAVELFPEGYGQAIVSIEAFFHGPAACEAITEFLEGPETDFPAMMNLCSTHEDAREALFYFGSGGNPWANFYKVLEIVQDDCGETPQLVKRNWCTKSELERFKRTANHQEAIGAFSRHARMRADPPSNPMSVEEARSFVGKLLSSWINQLLTHASRGSGGIGDRKL